MLVFHYILARPKLSETSRIVESACKHTFLVTCPTNRLIAMTTFCHRSSLSIREFQKYVSHLPPADFDRSAVSGKLGSNLRSNASKLKTFARTPHVSEQTSALPNPALKNS